MMSFHTMLFSYRAYKRTCKIMNTFHVKIPFEVLTKWSNSLAQDWRNNFAEAKFQVRVESITSFTGVQHQSRTKRSPELCPRDADICAHPIQVVSKSLFPLVLATVCSCLAQENRLHTALLISHGAYHAYPSIENGGTYLRRRHVPCIPESPCWPKMSLAVFPVSTLT